MYYCNEGDRQNQPSVARTFDAVGMLGHSHARRIRSSCLSADIGLAEWVNQSGHVEYRAPRHHILSYYATGRAHLSRLAPDGHNHGRGTFSILPAGHSSKWALTGKLDFIHLYLDPSHLDSFAASIDGDERHVHLPELTFAEDPYLNQLFRFAVRSLDWRDNADQMALSRIADLVMLCLIKNYNRRNVHVADVHYSLAPTVERRVKDYIESNLEQKLTVSDLASVATLSSYHFARMFKHATGMGPYSYVTMRRIALARRLLEENRLSIAEIAARCGFSSQSHFTGRFKQATGVTPSQYRIG